MTVELDLEVTRRAGRGLHASHSLDERCRRLLAQASIENVSRSPELAVKSVAAHLVLERLPNQAHHVGEVIVLGQVTSVGPLPQ